MVLSCPLKLKRKVPTSFGELCTLVWDLSIWFPSPVTCWGHFLVEFLMSMSRSSLLCWSNSLEKTLAASFLVELTLAACVLKFSWEMTESISIQYINFHWASSPIFSMGWYPCLRLYLLLSSPETPVIPSPENRPPASAWVGKGDCPVEGIGEEVWGQLLLRLPTNLLPSLHPYFWRHPMLTIPGPFGSFSVYTGLFLWLFSTTRSGCRFPGSSGSVYHLSICFSAFEKLLLLSSLHSLHPLSVCLFSIPLLSF